MTYKSMRAHAHNTTDSSFEPAELEAFERLIDLRGIESVLVALSEICGAKAEHIAVNWQDTALAKRWAVIEGAVGTIVPKAGGL
jgi:hypothetical protein